MPRRFSPRSAAETDDNDRNSCRITGVEAGASSSAGAGAADLGPDLRSRATRRTSSGNSGDPDRDESPVHRTPGRGRLPHCRIDEFRLTSMDPATCGRGRIDGSAAPAGLGTYGRSCPEPQGSRAGRRRRSKRGCSIRQRHKGIRETQPQFHGGRRDRRGCRGHYGRPSLGLPVRGYISMCFGDPWEAPCPSSVSPTSQRP